MNTDRIEKSISLRAPRSRVWRALTDAEEFGQWFGVRLEGAFAPGVRLKGRVTNKGYEHVPFELTVERMEPEELFSWRWHPYALDPNVDYSTEPTTLIVFTLEEVGAETLLTVVETGFDGIPLGRRLEAYRANEGGWAHQMKAIEKYAGQEAAA